MGEPSTALPEEVQQNDVAIAPDVTETVVDTLTSMLSAAKLEGDEDSKAFNIFKTEGNTCVKTEKYAEALEKYGQAWNYAKSEDDRAMILNNRRVVYEKMGETDKALEIFDEALKIKPGYIKVLIRRSLVNKKLGKFDEAMDDITEAHVLYLKQNQAAPGLQEPLESLILEYAEAEIKKLQTTRVFGFVKEGLVKTFLRGFYCDPVARIWRGLDPAPAEESESAQGDAKSGFPTAMNCLKEGKYAELITHCTTELENVESKYRIEALLLRGSINFLSGNKDEGLADLNSIIEDANASNEHKSCAHLKKALLLNIWDTSEATAEEFAKAEDLWKENADIYYHAAVCLVDKGEAIPALALLEKGMEICSDPKQFPLLHVMGLTIKLSYDACTGEPNSRAAYDKLKEMEKNNIFDGPECHEMYAQALILIDGIDVALVQFEKAKEVSGGEQLFALKKVMAQHMFKNDPETTIKALSDFADDPDVGNAALYHMGELNFVLDRPEEGFRYIDKAIETSTSVYDTRIRVTGKVDFKYNMMMKEKLKNHGINMNPLQNKDMALE